MKVEEERSKLKESIS